MWKSQWLPLALLAKLVHFFPALVTARQTVKSCDVPTTISFSGLSRERATEVYRELDTPPGPASPP